MDDDGLIGSERTSRACRGLLGVVDDALVPIESLETNRMNLGRLLYLVGRVPLVGSVLRYLARIYPEASVTDIRSGPAAGLRWRRYRRYVNGYWLGIYEPAIQNAICRYLRPCGVFYDVGANAGFFSLLGSRRVGTEGHVYSFEPLPENADVFDEQVSLNGLKNVTLTRAGVGASEGHAELARTGDGSTARLAAIPGAIRETLSIRLVTLDGIARTHRPPTFVKVDVEGAEGHVVDGASEVIERHRPVFLFELHGDEVGKKVMNRLATAGYTFTLLDGSPTPAGIVPPHVLAFPPTGISTK